MDFTDEIFREKIRKFIDKGVVFIAAVGNDGPYFGSINSPADMIEVISVGGLGIDGKSISPISSRGMTRQELLYGQGRIKPDVVAPSSYILT